MDNLTSHSLAKMEALDLVNTAINQRISFKLVALELGKRPPSKIAAEAIIGAYRRGDAPPWLTALLLGECRDQAGYATVREILLSAPRQLAESYAGVALARIGGYQALEDLKELLLSAPDRRSREGAAYGLRSLALPEAVSVIFEAVLAGKIRWETGAQILSGKFASEEMILKPLLSGDKHQVRVATEILYCTITNIKNELPPEKAGWFFHRPGKALLRALEQVLSDSQITISPHKRSRLRSWLELHSRAENSSEA